jgi:hypothetical protein
MLLGVASVVYGLGLVSDERLASTGGDESRRGPSSGVFLGAYIGSLVVAVALGFYVEWLLGTWFSG